MIRSDFEPDAILSIAFSVFVDGAAKSFVILAAATLAVLLLRRFSAAMRHLIWLLAMGAVVLLPLLSAMLPDLKVLPGWISLRSVSAHVEVVSAETLVPAPPARSVPIQPTPTLETEVAPEIPIATPTVPAKPVWNAIRISLLIWLFGFLLRLLPVI